MLDLGGLQAQHWAMSIQDRMLRTPHESRRLSFFFSCLPLLLPPPSSLHSSLLQGLTIAQTSQSQTRGPPVPTFQLLGSQEDVTRFSLKCLLCSQQTLSVCYCSFELFLYVMEARSFWKCLAMLLVSYGTSSDLSKKMQRDYWHSPSCQKRG